MQGLGNFPRKYLIFAEVRMRPKKVTMGGHISFMIGVAACETPARGCSKNRKIWDRVDSKDQIRNFEEK